MTDTEEQDDELTAIESIYAAQFAKDDGLRGGKIEIPVTLNEKLTLFYRGLKTKPTRSKDIVKEEKASLAQQKKESIEVAYLPPVTIHFSYPDKYPSSVPPEYTLSCCWLAEDKLEFLCERLDDLWLEQGAGNVIVFQWIQYLSDNVLSILDIKSSFLLEVKHRRRGLKSKKRSYQDATNVEALAGTLHAYNQQEKERVFNSTMFPCSVCFNDVCGSECVLFAICNHIYCKECMAEYFRLQIADGAVTRLTCPFGDCTTQAHPKQVQGLVDADLYARYEKFLLKSGLDSMSDVVYCPRTDCQEAVVIEDVNSPCLCATCGFAFCLSCKRGYHGVSPCPVSAKEFDVVRNEYINGTVGEREILEKRYGKKRLKHLLEDSISEEWVEQNSKRCPVCRSSIQKTEGCNKMTCFQCSKSFCWICMAILPASNPYNHFNNPNSRCNNKLFEGTELEEDDEFEEEFEDFDEEELILFL